MISMIAAMASNGVIGFQNKLPPWKVPADMKRFKRLTTGHPVIMGRKTFESMGRALPGRSNMVLTRSGFDAPGCITADSLTRAIEDIRVVGFPGHEEIFIIGGEKVYEEALALKIVDRIYLTVIYDDFPGDAFFPKIDEKEWEIIGLEAHEKDEKNLHHYDFLTYRRKTQVETGTYKPFNERNPDTQYRDLLEKILRDGTKIGKTQLEESALQCIGHKLRFDLSNGFPLITERDLCTPIGKGKFSVFHQALGELFAFLHGARTLLELEAFDCHWWKSWATEEKCRKRGLEPGDCGPGFYGAAWTQFPCLEGTHFNQIAHLLGQMRELPHLRTHILVPWIPQYLVRGQGKQQKVTVVPCHGLVHFSLDPERKEVTTTHFQRSADVPVGLVCNFIQYAALTMMVAQALGYKAKELVYLISDAHIYANQVEAVHKLLKTEPQRFPTMELDPSVTNILDFRQHHFKVTDYHPQEKAYRIATPT